MIIIIIILALSLLYSNYLPNLEAHERYTQSSDKSVLFLSLIEHFSLYSMINRERGGGLTLNFIRNAHLPVEKLDFCLQSRFVEGFLCFTIMTCILFYQSDNR